MSRESHFPGKVTSRTSRPAPAERRPGPSQEPFDREGFAPPAALDAKLPSGRPAPVRPKSRGPRRRKSERIGGQSQQQHAGAGRSSPHGHILRLASFGRRRSDIVEVPVWFRNGNVAEPQPDPAGGRRGSIRTVMPSVFRPVGRFCRRPQQPRVPVSDLMRRRNLAAKLSRRSTKVG